MKKEFYIGQPLIIKETGEKVTFAYDDGDNGLPCNIVRKDGYFYLDYYNYDQLEPSTEFTFSELMAGLEQCYFEVGTEFRMSSTNRVVTVKQGVSGLYLDWLSEPLVLTSKDINSTWVIIETRKEMTLEEIEAELGYKVKLKEKIGG